MLKKILSFDVGIRNLGVALIEYDFRISPLPLSLSLPASTVEMTDNNTTTAMTNTNDTATAMTNTNDTTNNTGPVYPWKNLKIIHLELIDMVNEVSQHSTRKPRAGAKPKTAKSININLLCQGIVSILFQRKHWLENVSDILVEQQLILRGRGQGVPSMGSARMKVIQHCILTFYETYFLLNHHLNKPTITPASPANKLKCLINEDNLATAPLFASDKNTDYKQRKTKAVDGFLTFIDWCDMSQELKTMFTDIKKQRI